ncbi:MAG: hypothetical protein ACLR0B_14015 [Anaerobutyricum soehngenii]
MQTCRRRSYFRAHTDQETGQTIIAGKGELHLEITLTAPCIQVEATLVSTVAYKESFTKAVDIDSKYAKQSGGRGQYGHCKVRLSWTLTEKKIQTTRCWWCYS